MGIANHISLEILKNEPKCGSFMWILDFKLKLDGSRMNWLVAWLFIQEDLCWNLLSNRTDLLSRSWWANPCIIFGNKSFSIIYILSWWWYRISQYLFPEIAAFLQLFRPNCIPTISKPWSHIALFLPFFGPINYLNPAISGPINCNILKHSGPLPY